VQEATTPEGAVADLVLARLRELNGASEPLGSFGAVIGATIEGGRNFDFGGPILAPGFGAQGGTIDDLRRIFGRAVGHVLPSTSRELLRQGPDGLASAADRLNDDLRRLAA
jgi:orotidine-5'-phosphate decarboxylase